MLEDLLYDTTGPLKEEEEYKQEEVK